MTTFWTTPFFFIFFIITFYYYFFFHFLFFYIYFSFFFFFFLDHHRLLSQFHNHHFLHPLVHYLSFSLSLWVSLFPIDTKHLRLTEETHSTRTHTNPFKDRDLPLIPQYKSVNPIILYWVRITAIIIVIKLTPYLSLLHHLARF